MKYTMGELTDIIDGDRGKNYPKQDEFFDNEYCLFLDTGNVTSTGFSFDSNHFITEDKCNALKKGKLQRQDLVYTTRGTVGNVAYYGESIPFDHVRINSGMVILRVHEEKVSAPFLYQLLKHNSYRTYFKTFCTGSAQPQLPINNFSKIEIDIPSLEQQNHISDILSAYDDLIENNQKQIKLLEEAARRLYKEWFVDLRFPGHEATPIVDGVPEGWTQSDLDSICSVRKDTLAPSDILDGTPYIGLEHMPRNDICLCNCGDASDVASNKYSYQENDILFGKIRPYFHKVGFALNSGVASTDSIIMRAHDGLWGLLLMTASSDAFVDYTYQTCKEGSKMPRADWTQMKQYPVLVANDSVREQFEDNVKQITKRIKASALQNRSLAEARDRLLPKLMSGELEV